MTGPVPFPRVTCLSSSLDEGSRDNRAFIDMWLHCDDPLMGSQYGQGGICKTLRIKNVCLDEAHLRTDTAAHLPHAHPQRGASR